MQILLGSSVAGSKNSSRPRFPRQFDQKVRREERGMSAFLKLIILLAAIEGHNARPPGPAEATTGSSGRREARVRGGGGGE